LTLEANGIWINVYVKMHSISPLVYGAIEAHLYQKAEKRAGGTVVRGIFGAVHLP
jgi:hypothetical protein